MVWLHWSIDVRDRLRDRPDAAHVRDGDGRITPRDPVGAQFRAAGTAPEKDPV